MPDAEPDDVGPDAEPTRDEHDPIDHSDALLTQGGQVDRGTLFDLYEANEGDDEQPISVQFVLSRDLNKRLDRYLVDRIPFLSRTALQRLIKEEGVTVNGRTPRASTKLRRGDTVVAILPPPPCRDIPAEDIPLEIIYEDPDLVLINKPADIIVHPARGNRSGTIINALAYHFQHRSDGALSTVGESLARPGVVHRLDRHTTGVMVVAKSDTAHWRLAHQFEHRTTDKRYLAVVHGVVEPPADVIDLPLGKHSTVKHKYAVRWDQGKESVTVYRVLEKFDDFTLVELELKTGRTHQIRVHLSYLGYPIVGDDVYGGRHITVGDVAGPAGTADHGPREPLMTRQALHARRLSFKHPMSDEAVTFEAPLPEDFEKLLAVLREYRS